MLNALAKFLKEKNISNKKVIVGFSSGPDSAAMAFLLSKIQEEFNLKIVIAYFNHNWRPIEVKKEQKFAQEFAKKINAEFYSETADENCAKTEEIARNLRYSFFENVMKKFQTDVVFLAHNKNDNIETLVYRLIKGTGTIGLCSIPQVRDNYYRPLLDITKAEILEFLKENNIQYMIDSSNDDVKYKRNLIRKEILPLFEKINPDYLNSIQNLINNAISTRLIVDNVLDEVKKDILIDDNILQDKYISLSKALRYEILNDFVGDKLKNHSSKNIKKIDDFILENNNSQISINKELYLKIKRNKIYFVKHNDYKD